MDEAIEVLTRAWTEEAVRPRRQVLLGPAARGAPAPRAAAASADLASVIAVESLDECGRAGVPVMMSRVANARIPERLARYREGLEAGDHDAATARHSFGVSGEPAPLSSGRRLTADPRARALRVRLGHVEGLPEEAAELVGPRVEPPIIRRPCRWAGKLQLGGPRERRAHAPGHPQVRLAYDLGPQGARRGSERVDGGPSN